MKKNPSVKGTERSTFSSPPPCALHIIQMSRFLSSRRFQIDSTPAPLPRYDGIDHKDPASETLDDGEDGKTEASKLSSSNSRAMGIEADQKSSRLQDCKGDYLNVRSRPYIMKILDKQGDRKILFADKILKFTCSGKMKHRVLLITDFAIYIVDPDTDTLKRRVALAAVEKLCLSELSDNFFAIIIPTEYDLLMASTRKTEIAAVFVETTRSASDYELEVSRSRRFEYNAASEIVKEVCFEEVEGGVRTRIVRK